MIRYQKNKDFNEIRMDIIHKLNSYDWENKIIDNTEEIKKRVIDLIQSLKLRYNDDLEIAKRNGTLLLQFQAETYIKAIDDCLHEIEEFL